MTDYRQIDEPSPTIVGPRPAEGEGGKVKVPQGLERLLTLAGLSAEWRGKVLADPLAAAEDAKIELSESERAILKSVSKPALAGMADSFARKHGGSAVAKYATGAVAAAALLATGFTSYAGDKVAVIGAMAGEPPNKPPQEGVPAPAGIRPDVPEEAPAVLWMTVLDDALAQAKKDNRAVMAVFLPPATTEKPKPPPPPTRGISIDEPEISVAEKSHKVLLADSKEFRAAVKNANLLAVRVAKPSLPPLPHPLDPALGAAIDQAIDAHKKNADDYQAALKKYGLDEKKLPAVVFLAPDGTELAKLVQPDEEAKLIEAIKDVPPRLAKWITEQRKPAPAPAATDGIRPDHPATKGSRPDVPEGKL